MIYSNIQPIIPDDFRYVHRESIIIDEKKKTIRVEGTNDQGLYNIICRLSDGSVKKETRWDLKDRQLCSQKLNKSGTRNQLKEEGLSLKEIFYLMVDATTRVPPIERVYSL